MVDPSKNPRLAKKSGKDILESDAFQFGFIAADFVVKFHHHEQNL
jgi:hypothetical protein